MARVPTRAPLVRYFGIKAKQPLLDVTHEAESTHPAAPVHHRERQPRWGRDNRGKRTGKEDQGRGYLRSLSHQEVEEESAERTKMGKYVLRILWLGSLLAVSLALPTNDKKDENVASMYSDCVKKDSMSCMKYRVFTFVDKLLADKEDITLSEGITVVKTSNVEDGAPRSIESTDLDTLLFDRLGRFLKTHTVKVDLKGSDILGAIESAGRSFEDLSENAVESRGKKKKAQKILGPLMMALALKAAALLPLALGAIALIAGKALLVGKIALVISAIIGLKKLLGSSQKHVTYEVVAHPHHSSSHVVSHDDGGHGGYGGGGGGAGDYGGGYSGSSGHGWARSLPQDAHEIAYRAHQPQPQA
ncbi:hypothetical protein KM043_006785 [Ampulex compressa]|nr:hypothetical protein KM043_006785 [Ampulex compressa]